MWTGDPPANARGFQPLAGKEGFHTRTEFM